MTLQAFDSVHETSTSTGTGNFVLAGAISGGFQTFGSKLTNGQQGGYRISAPGASLWECGTFTYNSGPNSITRSVVEDGSSGPGTLVNFTAGTWQVVLTLTATNVVQASNNLSELNASTARTNLGLGSASTQNTSAFAPSVDGVTLDTSGSGGTTEVKAGGIGTTQLAANGVTSAKMSNVGPGVTGPIGSTTTTPVVTIDAAGRVTGLTSATIATNAGTANVLYASKNGAALNTNLSSGTGTDDTSALQTAINTLNTNGGGILYIDGPTQFSQLVTYTNVTIDFCGFGAFWKSGSVIGCMITNDHNTVTGPTTPTDQYCVVRNGYINGNRVGGHGNANLRLDGNAKYLAIIGFFGVTKPRIENITFYESPCYNVWFANAPEWLVEGCTFLSASINTANNQDGIHCSGYSHYGLCIGCTFANCDNPGAVNADDGYTSSGSSDYGWQQPGVIAGPIDGVIFAHNILQGPPVGFRVTSSVSRIDNIAFIGNTGFCQAQILIVDGLASVSAASNGNIGNILYADNNIQATYNGGYQNWDYITILANMDAFDCNNTTRYNSTYTGTNAASLATIWLQSGYAVKQISVRGLTIYDTVGQGANDPLEHIQIDGTVNQLVVNGVNRSSNYNPVGYLIGGSGTIGSLSLSGYIGYPALIQPGFTYPLQYSGDAFTVAPRIFNPTLNATIGATVTVNGCGMSTVSSITVNGVAATPTIVNDSQLTFVMPSTTSGMVILTSPFGTGQYLINVGGFYDSFVRSNRALNGDNGWAFQGSSGSSSTYAIANDVLNNGYPSPGQDIITNSGVSTASGVVQAWLNLNGVGSAIDLICRWTGGSSGSGYSAVFDMTTGPIPQTTLYRVNSGAFTQIGGSNTSYSKWLMQPGPYTLVSVAFASGTFTFYAFSPQIGTAILLKTYTDGSPYTSAGVCGFRQDYVAANGGNLNNSSRFCAGFACGA